MKFLIDNQLPSALSRLLTSRGFDCCHVLDVGLAEASDREIWRYACETKRVIISKDEDFFFLASQEEASTSLVWVRLGNCRTSALLEALERLWPRVEASLNAGERVVELRD